MNADHAKSVEVLRLTYAAHMAEHQQLCDQEAELVANLHELARDFRGITDKVLAQVRFARDTEARANAVLHSQDFADLVHH